MVKVSGKEDKQYNKILKFLSKQMGKSVSEVENMFQEIAVPLSQPPKADNNSGARADDLERDKLLDESEQREQKN